MPRESSTSRTAEASMILTGATCSINSGARRRRATARDPAAGEAPAIRALNTLKRLLSRDSATRHAFQLERAIPHDDTAITGTRPLVFATPPACWAYAVSLRASWPAPARAPRERDGSVGLRIRVSDGCVSALQRR